MIKLKNVLNCFPKKNKKDKFQQQSLDTWSQTSPARFPRLASRALCSLVCVTLVFQCRPTGCRWSFVITQSKNQFRERFHVELRRTFTGKPFKRPFAAVSLNHNKAALSAASAGAPAELQDQDKAAAAWDTLVRYKKSLAAHSG